MQQSLDSSGSKEIQHNEPYHFDTSTGGYTTTGREFNNKDIKDEVARLNIAADQDFINTIDFHEHGGPFKQHQLLGYSEENRYGINHES